MYDNIQQMDKKTATINIKVTVAMRKKLMNKAREKYLSLSTFCRAILAEFIDKE